MNQEEPSGDTSSSKGDAVDASHQTDAKSPTNTLWDSFGISFFEKPKSPSDDLGKTFSIITIQLDLEF